MSDGFLKFGQTAIAKRHAAQAAGFSLIEIMMIIAMMSTLIIPFTMLMTQTSMTARGTYVQSSRSMLLNHLMNEMSPGRPDYYDEFHNTSNTKDTITESGQAIPYLRKLDLTKSDSMKKTTYFYLYNDSADANTSPRYKSTLNQAGDYMYMMLEDYDRIGYDGRQWYSFWTYNSSKERPGCTSCQTYYLGDGGANYINANYMTPRGVDIADTIFDTTGQPNYGSPLEFQFPVTNGDYTVKLYFSNASGSYNDTTTRIVMDILLEGTTYKSGYSPYETMRDIVTPTATPTNTISMQEFDVNVTDAVLNIRLNQNASSYYAPILSAIAIQKRRHQ